MKIKNIEYQNLLEKSLTLKLNCDIINTDKKTKEKRYESRNQKCI